MVPAVLTQAVRVRGRKRPLPQDPADPVDAASVQAPDPARERTADTPTDPNGQHARQDEQAAVPADDRRVLRDTDPDGASVAWGSTLSERDGEMLLAQAQMPQTARPMPAPAPAPAPAAPPSGGDAGPPAQGGVVAAGTDLIAAAPVPGFVAGGLGTAAAGVGSLALLGALGGGGGGGSSASTALMITSPSNLEVTENVLKVATLTSNKSGASWLLDGTGDDNNLFEINANTGVLSFKAKKDSETDKANYTVKVKVSFSEISGGAIITNTQSQTLSIKLIDLKNEDAPDLTLAEGVGEKVSLQEAKDGAIKLGTIKSGRSFTVTYTSANGTSITQTMDGDGNERLLKLSDSQLQQLGSGSVTVQVVTHDKGQQVGEQDSLPVSLSFALDTVAPTIATSRLSVNENVVLAGTLAQPADPSETVTWDLANGGADNAAFSINKNTGALSWANGQGGDYESRASKTYAVKVLATDTAGNSTAKDIEVVLQDVVNEVVPVLALASSVQGTVSVDEALTGLLRISGLQNGLSVKLTWVNGSTTVSKTTPVAAGSTLDVALSQADIDQLGSGSIAVTAVSVDASGNTSPSSSLSLTLDARPPSLLTATALSVKENTQAVATLRADEAVTWSLDASNAAASAQNRFFDLSSAGALTFKSAAGGDFEYLPSYKLQVKATDAAGNTTLKALTVNLSDVVLEQVPSLAISNAVSGTVSAAEAVDAQGVLTVSNVPAGAMAELSFVRVGGGTATTLRTGVSIGQDLRVALTATELATLGDGVISVTAVQVKGADKSAASSALTFTLDARAPQITSSAQLSVAENVQAIATLTANEPVTWSIDTHANGGAANADAGLFKISAGGALSWMSAAGQDADKARSAANITSYKLRVIATDSAGNSTPQDLVVQVSNVNEPASFVVSSFAGSGLAPVTIDPGLDPENPRRTALQDFLVQNEEADESLSVTVTSSDLSGSISPATIQLGNVVETNRSLKDLLYLAKAVGISTLTFKLFQGANVEANLVDTRTFDVLAYSASTLVPTGITLGDGGADGGDAVGQAGDVLKVSVAFSEAVNVSGQPSVVLSVGGNLVTADYQSGSGSNRLVFVAREALPSGWSGSVSLSSWNLSAANAIVAAANAGNSLTSLTGQVDASFKVDAVAPVITPYTTLYHTRNLLLKTEAEAWAVLDNYQLSNLNTFASLAGRYNSDGTRSKGGDLGWAVPSNYVPEYARAILGLQAGEVTLAPVQSRYGWHLLYLEETQQLLPGSSYSTDGVNTTPVIADSGAGHALRVREGTATGSLVQRYGVSGGEAATWSLSSSDARANDLFVIDATGAIRVKSALSVDADTTYLFTLGARDTAGNLSQREIRITVTDTSALGTVAMSGTATEGQRLSATYSVADAQVAWRWQAQGPDGLWSDLPGALSASLTLPSDDSLVGRPVRAVAMVSDQAGVRAVYGSASSAVADDGVKAVVSPGTVRFLGTSGARNGWLNASDAYVSGNGLASTPDSLSVALSLSEKVQVSGTPRLALLVGNDTVFATYDAARSTLTELVFKYTVDSGRHDPDGVTISYYDANGAALTKADGGLLVPSFNAVTDSGIRIDSVAPLAPTVTLLDVAKSPNQVTAAEALGDLVSIAGTGAGNTVQVVFARGVLNVSKILAGSSEAVKVGLTAQDLAVLGEGDISVSVIVSDPAGNASWTYSAANAVNLPGNGGTFTLDTVAPQITRTDWRVNENVQAIATLTASEAIKSWALVSGTGDVDNALFKLDSATGVLTWAQAGGVNFEGPDTKSMYALRVQATDAAGNSTAQSMTVKVADVNEAPQLLWMGGPALSLPAAGQGTAAGAFRSGNQGWQISEPEGNTLYATFYTNGGSLANADGALADANVFLNGIQWRGSASEFNTLLGSLVYTEGAAGVARSGVALSLRLSDQGFDDQSASSSRMQTLLWRRPAASGLAATVDVTERGSSDSPPASAQPLAGLTLAHAASNGTLRKVTLRMVAADGSALAGDQWVLTPDAVTMGSGLTLSQSASGNAPAWTLNSTGAVSLDQWQAALRALQYQNSSDKPGGDRTLTLKFEDNLGLTLEQTQTLHMIQADDAAAMLGPVSAANQVQTVVVGAVNTLGRSVGAGFTVLDPDSSTLYLQIKPVNGELSGFVNGTNDQGLSTTISNGVVSLSGSPAALNTALGAMGFKALAAGAAQIEFRLSSASASVAAALATPTLSHHMNATAEGVAPDSTVPTFNPAGEQQLASDENQRSVGSLQDLLKPSEAVVWKFAASGEDNNRFEINALTGVLSWKSAALVPDFEASTKSVGENDNLFKVSVVATDLAGNTASTEVRVQLRDVDEAPVRNSASLPVALSSVNTTQIALGTYWEDPDSPAQTLRYTSADLPSGLSLAENGTLTLNAGASWPNPLAFHLTVSQTGGNAANNLSSTAPVFIQMVGANAIVPVQIDASDSTDLAGVGRAGQSVQIRVTLSSDVSVSGTPSATFVLGERNGNEGLSVLGNYLSESNGVLLFQLALPSDRNSESIRLSQLTVNGGVLSSDFVATPLSSYTNNSTTALTTPYLLDNSAPSQPVWRIDANALASGNGLSATELVSGQALKLIAEAGSSLGIKITDASGGSVSKTLTAQAGETVVDLSSTDVGQLALGDVQVQVGATDLAGNLSALAYTRFNLI